MTLGCMRVRVVGCIARALDQPEGREYKGLEVLDISEEQLELKQTAVMTGDWFIFFFFQAEDGIRDYKVTGVQTCALPISRAIRPPRSACCVTRWNTPFTTS